MAKEFNSHDVIIELLKKLLIVDLAKAGVPQNTIKKLVGVSTNKVNEIVKHFKLHEKG